MFPVRIGLRASDMHDIAFPIKFSAIFVRIAFTNLSKISQNSHKFKKKLLYFFLVYIEKKIYIIFTVFKNGDLQRFLQLFQPTRIVAKSW